MSDYNDKAIERSATDERYSDAVHILEGAALAAVGVIKGAARAALDHITGKDQQPELDEPGGSIDTRVVAFACPACGRPARLRPHEDHFHLEHAEPPCPPWTHPDNDLRRRLYEAIVAARAAAERGEAVDDGLS